MEAELLLRGREPAPSPSSAGALLAVAPRSRPGLRCCQAAALSRSLPAGSWSPPRLLLRVTALARRREALGARRCGLQSRRLGQERV